ncbi:hypothetical protein Bca52824_085083 [Brassica carinata]|uniref:Uncharacterized protein n=1 Tax=Brassica carinata TaxID=52824 RepID=A0A8X7PPU7_BRACI|nr:hypothetical protein Bca52824_085083 [Brassica carinata]
MKTFGCFSSTKRIQSSTTKRQGGGSSRRDENHRMLVIEGGFSRNRINWVASFKFGYEERRRMKNKVLI